MTTHDIDIMTITILDKDGNGYMRSVDRSLFSVVIQVAQGKFVPIEALSKTTIEELCQT